MTFNYKEKGCTPDKSFLKSTNDFTEIIKVANRNWLELKDQDNTVSDINKPKLSLIKMNNFIEQGFLCFDYDHIDNVDKIFEKLKNNQYIYYAEKSRSLNGFFIIFKIFDNIDIDFIKNVRTLNFLYDISRDYVAQVEGNRFICGRDYIYNENSETIGKINMVVDTQTIVSNIKQKTKVKTNDENNVHGDFVVRYLKRNIDLYNNSVQGTRHNTALNCGLIKQLEHISFNDKSFYDKIEKSHWSTINKYYKKVYKNKYETINDKYIPQYFDFEPNKINIIPTGSGKSTWMINSFNKNSKVIITSRTNLRNEFKDLGNNFEIIENNDYGINITYKEISCNNNYVILVQSLNDNYINEFANCGHDIFIDEVHSMFEFRDNAEKLMKIKEKCKNIYYFTASCDIAVRTFAEDNNIEIKYYKMNKPNKQKIYWQQIVSGKNQMNIIANLINKLNKEGKRCLVYYNDKTKLDSLITKIIEPCINYSNKDHVKWFENNEINEVALKQFLNIGGDEVGNMMTTSKAGIGINIKNIVDVVICFNATPYQIQQIVARERVRDIVLYTINSFDKVVDDTNIIYNDLNFEINNPVYELLDEEDLEQIKYIDIYDKIRFFEWVYNNYYYKSLDCFINETSQALSHNFEIVGNTVKCCKTNVVHEHLQLEPEVTNQKLINYLYNYIIDKDNCNLSYNNIRELEGWVEKLEEYYFLSLLWCNNNISFIDWVRSFGETAFIKFVKKMLKGEKHGDEDYIKIIEHLIVTYVEENNKISVDEIYKRIKEKFSTQELIDFSQKYIFKKKIENMFHKKFMADYNKETRELFWVKREKGNRRAVGKAVGKGVSKETSDKRYKLEKIYQELNGDHSKKNILAVIEKSKYDMKYEQVKNYINRCKK